MSRRVLDSLCGLSGRISIAGMLLSVALMPFASVMARPTSASASTVISTCALDSLHFDPSSASGLGHGAYVVRVQYVGRATCALSGFPRVRFPLEDRRDPHVQRSLQKVMPSASTAAIRDTLNSYAGGFMGRNMSGGQVRLPLVLLTPRKGFASFTLVWAEISPDPCPVSRVLGLGLAGDTSLRKTRQFAFVCSEVDVTPFASGKSGSWN